MNNHPMWTGFLSYSLCLFLPLAALPPMDGEFTTVASWYGPGFQGRETASGERFDQNKLTAASRTLPFGTKLTVKNPQNGRTCEVVINDRGPYIKGRGLDLSREAARRLGIGGIARVICYTGGLPKSDYKPRAIEPGTSEPIQQINDVDDFGNVIPVADVFTAPAAISSEPNVALSESIASAGGAGAPGDPANKPVLLAESPTLDSITPRPAAPQAPVLKPRRLIAGANHERRARVHKKSPRRSTALHRSYELARSDKDRSLRQIAYTHEKTKFGRKVSRWTNKVAHICRGFKGIFAAVF